MSSKDTLEMSEQPIKTTLSIDEMLLLVGEYGFFQKLVNLLFCITMFPSCFPVLIMYFATKNPSWKCISNSTTCPFSNKTFDSKDNLRCSMERTEWEYVTSRDYSIVTEFDLICDNEFLVELSVSVLFFGCFFGASIIGWFADNFGRKKIHYISLTVVILVGCISVFVGNIYIFIACRFVIGLFLHGTFPQLYIMISEIVGNKDRAWANNVTYISVAIAFSFLALKAYLISSWKILFVVCTVPYSFVLLFYMFVPESVRYLRVKGEISEAMLIFQRMAYWNKTELSPHLTIKPAPVDTTSHTTSPLDLFRTKKMALITSVMSWSSFAGSMSFYCFYLAAGDITGHMYTDFVVITVLDIPMALIGTALVNRFGRKKNSMTFLLIGSASCIALGFTPKHGNMKILRLMFGMIGKTCIIMAGMARGVWAMELFPTHIRGEGVGLTQVANKAGATCSAWIDKRLSKIYEGGVFILIGILTFITVCLQTFLSDTHGVNIADTESENDSTPSNTSKCDGKEHIGDDCELQVTSYTNNITPDDEVHVSNIGKAA